VSVVRVIDDTLPTNSGADKAGLRGSHARLFQGC